MTVSEAGFESEVEKGAWFHASTYARAHTHVYVGVYSVYVL